MKTDAAGVGLFILDYRPPDYKIIIVLIFYIFSVNKIGRTIAEGVLLAAILVTAAVFRWSWLDWDDYRHFHPDERYISWVATTIEFERPSSLAAAFSPSQSTLNPFYWPADAESPGIVVPQDEARDFAYGHVPLYLGVVSTRFFDRLAPILIPLLPAHWLLTQDLLNQSNHVEYIQLTAVARAVTGLFDLGTIIVIFWLGRRMFGVAVGLLTALFLTLNVMHIQLAHFFITDPFLTFFVVSALAAWIEAVFHSQLPRLKRTWLILGCILMGLAVGSKFAAILLVLPLVLTIWTLWPQHWLRWTFLGGTIALLTFFFTNPFAILDFSCDLISPAIQLGPLSMPQLNWGSCYLENVLTQSSMVSGEADLPFTRQYSGTPPFWYFIEMQLKWGMGPLLGAAAFLGLGWTIIQVYRPLRLWLYKVNRNRRVRFQFRLQQLRGMIIETPIFILLAWCLPYFLFTGTFFVKFMRYMQPLVPFLMLFGAAMLWHWRRPFWRSFAILVVVSATAVYAVAFFNMYQTPHPWLLGSGWIYANVPAGTLILSEKWDDSLPSSMMVEGTYRRRSEYRNEELTWLTRTGPNDSEEKLLVNLALLSEADYLTITSNRIYGVVPRLPERYPLSNQYHQLLFDGKLGYEPVFVADRAPNIFGWFLQADTFSHPNLTPPELVTTYFSKRRNLPWGFADESFTVYDQPLTIIFRNEAYLSVDDMRSLFKLDE